MSSSQTSTSTQNKGSVAARLKMFSIDGANATVAAAPTANHGLLVCRRESA